MLKKKFDLHKYTICVQINLGALIYLNLYKDLDYNIVTFCSEIKMYVIILLYVNKVGHTGSYSFK